MCNLYRDIIFRIDLIVAKFAQPPKICLNIGRTLNLKTEKALQEHSCVVRLQPTAEIKLILLEDIEYF